MIVKTTVLLAILVFYRVKAIILFTVFVDNICYIVVDIVDGAVMSVQPIIRQKFVNDSSFIARYPVVTDRKSIAPNDAKPQGRRWTQQYRLVEPKSPR